MSEEKFTSEADKQVTVSFTIEENIRRDAWNWWDAVNKLSTSPNFRQLVSSQMSVAA
jgi:hypothetical protein